MPSKITLYKLLYDLSLFFLFHLYLYIPVVAVFILFDLYLHAVSLIYNTTVDGTYRYDTFFSFFSLSNFEDVVLRIVTDCLFPVGIDPTTVAFIDQAQCRCATTLSNIVILLFVN